MTTPSSFPRKRESTFFFLQLGSWKKRWIPAFVGMTLAGCSAATVPATSNRIVSTNPCLDAILVELVPPDRIAAISRYSQDPRSSSMAVSLARRLPATSGTAEEVIALKPGLVLASSFTAPATLAAYRRLGLKVATFGTAATIAENRTRYGRSRGPSVRRSAARR